MYTERKENHLTVTVGPRQGKYRNMPTDRQFKIKVLGSAIPETITINGNRAEYEYIGDELALLITIPQTACDQEKNNRKPIPDLHAGIKRRYRFTVQTIQQSNHCFKIPGRRNCIDACYGSNRSYQHCINLLAGTF